MSANATNRTTAQNALAADLTTALTGPGAPAQAVVKGMPTDLKGQSPVVAVACAGAGRARHGIGTTTYDNHFFFEIVVFVADECAADDWTSENVDDALSLIEKRIADYVADHRKTDNWLSLAHDEDGPSRILHGDLSGHPYAIEIIPITVEVVDG